MKVLVIYQGYTSGTFMGRDDGYPEVRYALYDNLPSAVARDYKPSDKARYFWFPEDEVDPSEVEQVKTALAHFHKDETRERKLREIERLKKEVEG